MGERLKETRSHRLEAATQHAELSIVVRRELVVYERIHRCRRVDAWTVVNESKIWDDRGSAIDSSLDLKTENMCDRRMKIFQIQAARDLTEKFQISFSVSRSARNVRGEEMRQSRERRKIERGAPTTEKLLQFHWRRKKKCVSEFVEPPLSFFDVVQPKKHFRATWEIDSKLFRGKLCCNRQKIYCIFHVSIDLSSNLDVYWTNSKQLRKITEQIYWLNSHRSCIRFDSEIRAEARLKRPSTRTSKEIKLYKTWKSMREATNVNATEATEWTT